MSDSPRAPSVLRLEDVRKSYAIGKPNETEVLHGISLELRRDAFVALTGPSGSGKSTLLNLLGLLDQASGGELYLLDQPTTRLNDDQRTRMRQQSIGFVFQFHHLISAFTALENVLMPVMARLGSAPQAIREQAIELLDSVGLHQHMHKRPGELSGGQQQRVAIVRALIQRPALLLADEPTGNLDTHSADEVFELFRRFHREHACGVLIVTHDGQLAERCDRIINLVDGHIESDREIRR